MDYQIKCIIVWSIGVALFLLLAKLMYLYQRLQTRAARISALKTHAPLTTSVRQVRHAYFILRNALEELDANKNQSQKQIKWPAVVKQCEEAIVTAIHMLTDQSSVGVEEILD